jgi:hypothetical protein
LRVQATNSPGGFEVTIDGTGVVGHAGAALLRELADRLGLTAALGWRQANGRRRHPDTAVLRDLAVVLADGGDCLSDLAVLRDQPALFGPVASTPTAWRTVERIAKDADGLARLRAARAHARARAWAAGGHPDVEVLVVDADATLVLAHTDAKEGAAGTYKGSFGFCPLLAYLDRGPAPGEPLAGVLRAGNAAPGAAADLVELADLALDAAPRERPAGPGAKRQRRRQQRAGLAPARARRRVHVGHASRRPRARGDPGPARARLDPGGRARWPGS